MPVAPIDTAASLPDGSSFRGPAELRALVLSRKDDFIRCLAEKLLTYALGRGVEYYDASTVKAIRKAVAENGYRMSTLVMEVAVEQLMREHPLPDTGALAGDLRRWAHECFWLGDAWNR